MMARDDENDERSSWSSAGADLFEEQHMNSYYYY